MNEGERLEALLPRLMRVVLPSSEEDPMGHLPLGQIRMIRALQGGERSSGEVSDELGLSLSALSQMVSRMEETGLVQKRDLPGDRRCRMLSLTPKAVELGIRRRELRSKAAQAALNRLSSEEREALIELLAKLVGTAPIGPLSGAAEAANRSPY